VLKKGDNYGFPFKQSSQQKTSIKSTQTDNSSAIPPARTYYKLITPTQAIFYDGNKFPALKGKFLIVSSSESSIYVLTLNSTGSITEELAISLPEVRGHLIAIAKAPDGDIYLGGENIYKLISLENTRNILTYFIGLTGSNIAINGLSLNPANKVLSIDYSIKNNNNNETSNHTEFGGLASVQITIPKALLNGIFDVTSERYNKTSSVADKAVDEYKIRETRKVSDVGDTVIDIKLKNDFVGGWRDKILVNGAIPSTRVSEIHNNNRIILH
jgi:hypothetical protein